MQAGIDLHSKCESSLLEAQVWQVFHIHMLHKHKTEKYNKGTDSLNFESNSGILFLELQQIMLYLH